MLNLKNIKTDYPKSYPVLLKWTKSHLAKFQKMIIADTPPSEIPEVSDSMAEAAITGMISVNFRILYDFFDEEGVIVTVDAMIDGDFVNNFTQNRWSDRKAAEYEGFDCAFKTLESKL